MIKIKSQINNRARLSSQYFTKKFLENLDLSDLVLHTRTNLACKSIIVYFDENKHSLEDIINHLSSLIPVKRKENISCSLAACQACYPKKDLKKSALSFGALSIYALGIFATTTLPPTLTLAVSIFAALPLFKEALQDIKKRKFTLQTFMSLSLLGACFIGEISTAFEVIYILRGGMLLEEYASNSSMAKVNELLSSDIKKAYILIDDVEMQIDIDEIKKGDVVVVRSGEKIPVDGTIISGEAEISEALINGRSEPSLKGINDDVFSNTLVQKGRIFIKTNAVGSQTYLSKIISQVEFALASRSEAEKQADKLASKLLTLGSFLTVGTFFITGSFLRAFSVMIVMSCPCATILAASTAISAGIAKGAKEGILIKGGEYLEKFGQSDVICFDKTGTLTTGKPIVESFFLNDVSEEEFFYKACLAEYRNNHPLALSITNYAKEMGIHIDKKTNSEFIVGMGAKLELENETILVGNAKLMKKFKINTDSFDVKKYKDAGKSVVFVASNKKILGYLVFIHEPRVGIETLVKDLKNRGVKKIVLLTGDDEKVANDFAKKFDFDEVYADIMPEQKAEVVENLKNRYKIVSMVGDGINDTIAIARADVGISFASGGSEAAVEISDIAIINSNIKDILKLHDISKFSLKVVGQNYWIGTGTNLAGVGFASLGMLSPVAAGGLHIAHTVGIMANASRIALS